MGIVTSKCYTSTSCGSPVQLRARIRALEEDIEQLRSARERDARAYEEAAAARTRKETEQQQRRPGGNEHRLVEHVREQQAQREASVEKWKQLYLTIKTELDGLILRTRQGGHVFLGAEARMIEGLRRELKAREETVEALRSRLFAMEKEGVKREREIDILRQSLRILSNTKRKKNGTRKFL